MNGLRRKIRGGLVSFYFRRRPYGIPRLLVWTGVGRRGTHARPVLLSVSIVMPQRRIVDEFKDDMALTRLRSPLQELWAKLEFIFFQQKSANRIEGLRADVMFDPLCVDPRRLRAHAKRSQKRFNRLMTSAALAGNPPPGFGQEYATVEFARH